MTIMIYESLSRTRVKILLAYYTVGRRQNMLLDKHYISYLSQQYAVMQDGNNVLCRDSLSSSVEVSIFTTYFTCFGLAGIYILISKLAFLQI